MSTGLTLGKFAPLHRGHQRLIELTLAENDHGIVIVYDAPEVTSIPLPMRAGWIRTLYPTVEVIEAWDGPTAVGTAPAITAQHDAYLLRLLAGRRVDRFYSSEFYGDHVSRALGAADRRVDPERLQVPVSGRVIRQDPFRYRHFVAPLVYSDLIMRVVFVGAPSTGKTTLAAALALHFGTCWMPEYGREFWERHQQERRLTSAQLVEIAEVHRRREDALLADCNRYLFVDTDATTTFVFARHYHGAAAPRLAALAEEAERRYDVRFLCADDIPFEEADDRSGPANRALMQKWIRADLACRRQPFITLAGPLEDRIATVTRILAGHDRFRSIADTVLSLAGFAAPEAEPHRVGPPRGPET